MLTFSVKRVAGHIKSLSRNLEIRVLLENATYYFVLGYLTVDAETVLQCAEYNH
jgi:uncharacterized protein (UPF0276 family)